MSKMRFNATKDLITPTILVLGIALRLFHYLHNRSLWTDELYLVSGLLHMSYTDLAGGILDYHQKAPIGFLWLVKIFLDIFGYHEMILRLIPFLAGLVSLFLFVKISRYFLHQWGAIIAIALFAFSPALIYHTVEIKQYATECLATIIALYLFIKFRNRIDLKSNLTWGIFGGIILWFSFSVIFILAGIAAAVSLNSLLKKDWKLLTINLACFSIWILSFLLNYVLFTHKHADSEWIVYWFKTYDNFMPFPPHSLKELAWFPTNFLQLMDYPLGVSWNFNPSDKSLVLKIISIPFIPIILLFTGIISIFHSDKRNFLLFTFPIGLTLLASGLSLYPLLERFWVFIAPIFILLIAFGFDHFCEKVKSRNLQWLVILLLLSAPIYQSIYFILKPEKFYKHKKSFEREAFVYINDHFKEGDAVYNYWNNEPGYKVYKQLKHFKYQAIQGKDFRNTSSDLVDYNKNLLIDFNQFKSHQRVWVIYQTQITLNVGDKIDYPLWYYKGKLLPEENLNEEMKRMGKLLKKIVYSDVTICLFELTRPINNPD